MQTTKAPAHLRAATREWFEQTVGEFELDHHHIRLLTLAAESWDRCQQAREAVAKHGLTFVDKSGYPRSRPEIGIERDSRLAFARLLREIGLDVAPPPDTRPPRLRG